MLNPNPYPRAPPSPPYSEGSRYHDGIYLNPINVTFVCSFKYKYFSVLTSTRTNIPNDLLINLRLKVAPCGDLALRKTDSITQEKHIQMISKENLFSFLNLFEGARDTQKGNCKIETDQVSCNLHIFVSFFTCDDPGKILDDANS
jgi:hypothetical protein